MLNTDCESNLVTLQQQLDRLMAEINVLLVDVYDASAGVSEDILEQKKHQAAALGTKIAVKQMIYSSTDN